MYPAFSPDGRWIAYRSIESGTSEIYVRAFPDKGGKWQISNSGGETRLADTGFFQNLDITPDGKRFLVLMPAEEPGQQRANNQLTFLMNFFDEVRRRAP